MTRISFLFLPCCLFYSAVFAQEVLPGFTVKNNRGKISVSWQNQYPEHVKNISIQRSYDSIKNFSTLLSISNPAEAVNGYMDINAPYSKMFYKLFIVFDSGAYIFTGSKKPDIDPNFDFAGSLKKLKEQINEKNEITKATGTHPPINRKQQPVSKSNVTPELPKSIEAPAAPKKDVIIYPSKRVFTDKDNNINIILPDYKTNKYVIKFFDEKNKHLFNLQNINEGFLILEKMNFRHAGWFFFEIYEDGGLFEKNKIFIPKD